MGFFLPLAAHATDSFWSEASHFAGGILMGGAGTYAVDHYWPEHADRRVVIGIGIAAASGVIGEIHDSICGHPKKFSVLDAASATLGGVAGALGTDRWILTPVARKDHAGRYYGVVSQYQF